MLVDKYKETLHSLLLSKECFTPYPAANQRDKWEKIPKNIKDSLISRGEQFLNYDFLNTPASKYIDFSKGNTPQHYLVRVNENFQALLACVFAECSEYKGRFMEQVVNGIFQLCEETIWYNPACLYMSSSWPCIFPDKDDPVIDLSSSNRASSLAYFLYLLGSQLDSIDINLRKMVIREIKKRVLTPFYERTDIWWMAYTRKINPVMNILHPINNWTPHCTYHSLLAILFIEDDYKKRQAGVLKSMEIIDNYINYYSDDGCCDEGNGYWFMAPGTLMDYLEILSVATNGQIDISKEDKINKMGEFMFKAYIGKGNFINFADSNMKNACLNNKIVKYARQTENETLLRFALKFYNESSFFPQLKKGTSIDNILYYAFHIELIKNNFYLQDTTLVDYLPLAHYYEKCQVMTARESKGSESGLFLSCKGGHNDESHNHNDVGNVIVFFDAKPILVDAGVEIYSHKTFSLERYSLWTMQSKHHNVPSIDKQHQEVGHFYKATDLCFSHNAFQTSLSMNLKKAYSENIGISDLTRTVSLIRDKESSVSIVDNVSLYHKKAEVEFSFLTPCLIKIVSPSTLLIDETHLIYDNTLLKFSSEIINLTDERMISNWGNHLTRIKFITISPIASQEFVFKIIRAK